MAVTYSQDLRDRVLSAYDRGMRTREIATTFKVSESWARRVKQHRREFGRTSALPRGGKRFAKIDLDRLAELVRAQPDATLIELRDRLGVDCCDTSISRALRRLGLTFKKRQSMRRNRTDRMLRNGDANGSPARPDTTPDD
jgi:transposase